MVLSLKFSRLVTLKTSAFQSLYGGQFTLSTLLIKKNDDNTTTTTTTTNNNKKKKKKKNTINKRKTQDNVRISYPDLSRAKEFDTGNLGTDAQSF